MKFEAAKAIAQARSFGRCEGCGLAGRLDPHHRMTRGSGGVHGAAAYASNTPHNLLMLCRPCHDRTLAAETVAECIRLGWVVERRSGLNPREISAYIYTAQGRGWWFLRGDGDYEWDDAKNLAQMGLNPPPGYGPSVE